MKAKVYFILITLLMFVVNPFQSFAQDVVNNEVAEVVTVDVPGIPADTVPSILSLLGIVALASVIVTQLMKVIPAVKHEKLLKYAISILTGIILSFLGWWLQLTPELVNLEWYWVLIHGILAGIAASGGYGFIKSIWTSLPHN